MLRCAGCCYVLWPTVLTRSCVLQLNNNSVVTFSGTGHAQLLLLGGSESMLAGHAPTVNLQTANGDTYLHFNPRKVSSGPSAGCRACWMLLAEWMLLCLWRVERQRGCYA